MVSPVPISLLNARLVYPTAYSISPLGYLLGNSKWTRPKLNSIFSTNLLLFQCSQINKWQLILPTLSPKSTVSSYTIVPSALFLPQYSFIFTLYYNFYCFVSFHLQRRSLRVRACLICLNPEHLAQCMLDYLYKEAVKWNESWAGSDPSAEKDFEAGKHILYWFLSTSQDRYLVTTPKASFLTLHFKHQSPESLLCIPDWWTSHHLKHQQSPEIKRVVNCTPEGIASLLCTFHWLRGTHKAVPKPNFKGASKCVTICPGGRNQKYLMDSTISFKKNVLVLSNKILPPDLYSLSAKINTTTKPHTCKILSMGL